eukprot:5564377-Prymnesium_polylepis.1
MKEAIRLVLKELLLSKVCAKGGGTAGWLAPATAKELATLHDPPPPKLQPAALRDKERRVSNAMHTTRRLCGGATPSLAAVAPHTVGALA